ncbi:MAG TPA: hypothetical protein VIS96_13010 [Terrimicrobiaceae bacterium]
MTRMRNILLSAILLVLGACATQTFKPDQAPEYTITRNFTPFYQKRPLQGATTDASLSAKTRVKLLRKEMGYSLVLLEDSRTGYVSNKNMVVAPPGSQKKPFGSTSGESSAKPRRKKRFGPVATPTPSPVSQSGQVNTVPSQEPTAPSPTPPPDLPEPSPTPVPQAPVEKPKFRL